MLNRNELNRYGPPGFHLAQKEKDYAQHWILSFLSRSGFGGIFKGGTCLQKAFNLPRYSEDLDFTLNDSKEPESEEVSAFLSSAGFSNLVWKKEKTDLASKARLRFRGPLYNGTEISEGSVVLEFSKREKTLLNPNPIVITSPYPDLLPYQINVMDRREMAAEKIRAICTRDSARDLFDLYFLLHQRTEIRLELVEKKLEFYGLKFDYGKFSEKVKKLAKEWDREMSALTPNRIEYSLVTKLVFSEFEKASKWW